MRRTPMGNRNGVHRVDKNSRRRLCTWLLRRRLRRSRLPRRPPRSPRRRGSNNFFFRSVVSASRGSVEPRLSSFDESSKRASCSQIFGSKEGGDDNGCQEESQEGREEGREESQEGREEEVVARAGAQEPRPFFLVPSPFRERVGSGPAELTPTASPFSLSLQGEGWGVGPRN